MDFSEMSIDFPFWNFNYFLAIDKKRKAKQNETHLLGFIFKTDVRMKD